jgi:hypothetical protein
MYIYKYSKTIFTIYNRLVLVPYCFKAALVLVGVTELYMTRSYGGATWLI